MPKIDSTVEKLNAQLKAANVGFVIETSQAGRWLRLRGIFPAKPGAGKGTPHNQRLALGIRNNPAGLKIAFAEALRISGEIALGRWQWPEAPKSEPDPEPEPEPIVTVGDWVRRFELDFWQGRDREQARLTWEKDYWNSLKKLPSSEVLTVNLLLATIKRYPVGSRTRARLILVYKQLARFAELENADAIAMVRKGYNSVEGRDRPVPDDAQIWQDWQELDPNWRFVFGILVCYGLRPHEVYRSNYGLLSDRVVLIGPKTKTQWGKKRPRRVYPIAPDHWLTYLDSLVPELPKLRAAKRDGSPLNNSDYTVAIWRAMRHLTYTGYGLRHAYAIRGIHRNVPDAMVAQWMGHSVNIHQQVYQRWISDRDARLALGL
ncbi:MAG: hypothetical protein DDT26_01845 [Dehalococcoidia bacterium]|nr:hypothetical protein [Chloroflexota bacterium]